MVLDVAVSVSKPAVTGKTRGHGEGTSTVVGQFQNDVIRISRKGKTQVQQLGELVRGPPQ
jgi:hypothetical protein